MIVTVYGCAVIIVALYFFILNLLNSIWIRNHTQKTYTVSGPKVSVLIPARNEEKNIEACVVSFLRQSYQNYEIIFIIQIKILNLLIQTLKRKNKNL